MPATVTASSMPPSGSSVSSCDRCQTASRTRCAMAASNRSLIRTVGVPSDDQIPHEFASQRSGFVCHLTKPIRIDALDAALSAVLAVEPASPPPA